MWMRSATSKTCGMLWLIRTIGRPRFFTSSISSSTLRDSLTPSAAVGSSMMMTRLPKAAARAHRHALALAAGERLDRLADVLDGQQPERVQMLGAPRAACRRGRAGGRRCPSGPGLPRLAAEKQIVGDRQCRRQAQGSGRPSRCRRVRASIGELEMHRLAVQQDLAGVGDDRAGQRLDQRRLAGAVVADDAEDLARHAGRNRRGRAP